VSNAAASAFLSLVASYDDALLSFASVAARFAQRGNPCAWCARSPIGCASAPLAASSACFVVGIAALAASWITGEAAWIEQFFRISAALFSLWLAAPQVYLGLAVMRHFAPGEPMAPPASSSPPRLSAPPPV